MTEEEQQRILESWLEEHRGLLFKVVRAYAISSADRDDLFQEIAIQVWRSIPAFRRQSAVPTWLYRVALNTALTWKRDEGRHREGRRSLEQPAAVLRESPRASDPRLDWLYREIASLSEVDRSLMLLLLDGFSYREMSEILGISESNVGVKINRIKKHLTRLSKNESNHGI